MQNRPYEMPEWVYAGLQDGSVDHVSYSPDHTLDIVVMRTGESVVVDMRAWPRCTVPAPGTTVFRSTATFRVSGGLTYGVIRNAGV